MLTKAVKSSTSRGITPWHIDRYAYGDAAGVGEKETKHAGHPEPFNVQCH